MVDLFIPVLICLLLVYSLIKGVDSYSGFVKGEGYKCKECGFVPLFLEEPKEDKQIDLCDIC